MFHLLFISHLSSSVFIRMFIIGCPCPSAITYRFDPMTKPKSGRHFFQFIMTQHINKSRRINWRLCLWPAYLLPELSSEGCRCTVRPCSPPRSPWTTTLTPVLVVLGSALKTTPTNPISVGKTDVAGASPGDGFLTDTWERSTTQERERHSPVRERAVTWSSSPPTVLLIMRPVSTTISPMSACISPE